GKTKIATLKEAAGGLVSELMNNSKAVVSIGLVPYADYINVGKQYRNEPWLSIPADKTVQPNPKVCTKKTTKSVCPAGATAPKYACTKYVDGVAEPAQCGGGCTKPLQTITVPEYETCSGGGNPTNYTWHGCIGSRKQGKTRLDDLSPKFPYPGYVETSQRCLNPIVPLVKDKATLLAAINGMIINVGGYKPYTYIPAGLIWGQNILSSTEPFAQGAAYDPDNLSPRKVVVLMTDGDNTLRFSPGDGRHSALNSNPAAAKVEVGNTNADTASICEYMKTNKIEIFTVAFMVDNDDAKSLLEGCASDKDHYYDASDSEKLAAAFSGIAQSLTHVRLAR
ncbi:MAG: VWA domain-containing protein, partial [Pseudaminobacter sp.]|nr:VWA domain-containing protein [Pseudaminobacter sp.]